MIGDEYFQLRAQLGTALFSLQSVAGEMQAPTETLLTLQQLQQSLREPFIFVALGEAKAGKSSLLNALFGREFCKVDVLPATDRIHVFKYGEEEHDVAGDGQLTECYRPAIFLRDFSIVDTPGTSAIGAGHQTITGQFAPLADLIIFVFSATNPWAASAWEFLKLLNQHWLKRVIFVVQQADRRTPEEIAAIIQQLEQTTLERLGQVCPVFVVSAKAALEAKLTHADLAGTGFPRLEAFINKQVATGEPRLSKLRSVCSTAQITLVDLGARATEATAVTERDTARLKQLGNTLQERKEQSLRQIGGFLWTLAQTYEQAQKRGEELLTEKLTLTQTVKLIFNQGGWRQDFQSEIEIKLRESIQRQIESSLELLEADLRTVWQQLHESLQKNFADDQARTTPPDFVQQREELRRRIELTLLERGTHEQIEQQLGTMFAETAAWLRVPTFVAAGAGLVALVAAITHASIFDMTGTIAGVAALLGVALAVFKRQRIINEFRRQMTAKRETVINGIEDHLRHAIDTFYQDLDSTFAPMRAICVAQRKLYEPMQDRFKQLSETFDKCGSALDEAGRAG